VVPGLRSSGGKKLAAIIRRGAVWPCGIAESNECTNAACLQKPEASFKTTTVWSTRLEVRIEAVLCEVACAGAWLVPPLRVLESESDRRVRGCTVAVFQTGSSQVFVCASLMMGLFKRPPSDIDQLGTPRPPADSSDSLEARMTLRTPSPAQFHDTVARN